MLTRRIIPCLDIKEGRVVKGVSFANLRDMGEPLELARDYAANGADELCFLNITASVNNEPVILELVERISSNLFIPFTVGGGIRSVADARSLLRAGADKVALNTAALNQPELLKQLADEFGRQCVVLSIDTRRERESWIVTTHSATKNAALSCLEWAQQATELGAGEILLNAIDTDGHRNGFSLDITAEVSATVNVPVIASGGAGAPEHFAQVFANTGASAALAASIFHDGSWTPNKLKQYLTYREIEVRL